VTYTYVELDVSAAVFHEIATKLKEAGYGHAFDDDGRVIDMHGLALVSSDLTQRVESAAA
jgi:hypothetical protein